MDQTTLNKPLDVLKKYFGYDKFRLRQSEIINHILEKKDALVLMPTGGGKSLCYQIPALVFEGVTIVISPLIALMKDQVDALKANGVSAAYLNSMLSSQEQYHVLDRLKRGELKLLYLAPERLLGNDESFIRTLQDLKVSLIAIDEAHCISQWGHDFRPEYTKLAALKNAFPNVPVIALTATADKLTQDDILKQLNLPNPKKFVSSFNRENIHYYVSPKQSSYSQLINFLDRHKDDSGIIYTLSRSSAQSLADNLCADGYDAKPYHAGLDKSVRDKHQELFIKDEVKIITATIAFGMGIDKSNVRFVVHMDLPKNIEGYYQETGRAGRDGVKSEALLFYSYGDVLKLKSFVEVENNATQSQIMLKKLNEMATYGELRTCRRKYLLNYFDEEAPDACGTCDTCLNAPEKFDATIIAQKALSAVARLDQSFGAGYVIDFLRGSKSEKIRDQHKNIKTYGVGADISKYDWGQYFKDLIQLGYLEKDGGQYPILKLTQKSVKVLQGKEKVSLFKISSNDQMAVVQEIEMPFEVELLSELKTLRKQIADRENLPPYIVFSDATLQELATYLPLSVGELDQISGFGAVKMEKYGRPFLEVIVKYCGERDLNSLIHKKKKKRKRTENSDGNTPTQMESLKLFREGNNLEEIAKMRGLALTTIENHLTGFIFDGTLNVMDFVTKEVYDEVFPVVKADGGPALKPMKEKLREDISYGQLRAVYNYYLYLKNKNQ